MQHVCRVTALTSFSYANACLNDKLFGETRDVWCYLYGKPEYSSLDRLCGNLFASSKQELRSLPPTEDSFHFHVPRSVCQISLYKQANVCNPSLLSPELDGRYMDSNGRLITVINWKFSKPAAAKLKFCKCKKGCFKTVHLLRPDWIALVHAIATGTHTIMDGY